MSAAIDSQGNTLTYAGIAAANGIINSILVLGILPLYESIFGVTTTFKLLELSDLNAPIFKKMIIKANAIIKSRALFCCS
jgi:membrane-associated HD superfamily phosphohydrolase